MQIRRSGSDRFLEKMNYVFICIFLFIIAYPLYYLVVASFSDVGRIASEPFVIIPKGFTLSNYKAVFESNILWRGYLNSFLYLFVGVVVNTSMTILAAYPLSRNDLYGGKLMTKILVLTMYISGGLIPNYLVVKQLGLVNTFSAMILPSAVNAFMVIIAIAFFRNSIPKELQEQGFIDGCNNFQQLTKIVLPLSMPIIGVLALQYGLGIWNSYTQALIYLSNPHKFPLQLVLRDILISVDSKMMIDMTSHMGNYEKMVSLKEGIKYVSMVMSSLPLLILYPFLTRFFEKGLTLGAIKE